MRTTNDTFRELTANPPAAHTALGAAYARGYAYETPIPYPVGSHEMKAWWAGREAYLWDNDLPSQFTPLR